MAHADSTVAATILAPREEHIFSELAANKIFFDKKTTTLRLLRGQEPQETCMTRLSCPREAPGELPREGANHTVSMLIPEIITNVFVA